MLLQYFGFRQDPFGTSPDPRCLYLSRTHREAAGIAGVRLLEQPRFYCHDCASGNGENNAVVPFP